MSNIENLVSKIMQDGDAKAKAIIDDANAVAEKLIKAKADAANAQSDQIIQSAKLEAARTKAQIIEGKKLSIRDSKLLAKQAVIDKTFAQAIEELKQLSEADYTAFLERYLLSLGVAGDEALVLPKRYQDIDLKAINAKLKAKNLKGELTLLEDGKEIDGGFILVKDGIENNNTFESLLDYYRAELEMMVIENLF